MNWATERAREVVNGVGFRENPEAAIAAALREVAEEAVGICEAKVARFREDIFGPGSCVLLRRATEEIRARFPKEEV